VPLSRLPEIVVLSLLRDKFLARKNRKESGICKA